MFLKNRMMFPITLSSGFYNLFHKTNHFMINLKTKVSFDISLERKRKTVESKTTKSISKFFVVAKEIISKRLLRN